MNAQEKENHENNWAWEDHYVGYRAAQAGAQLLGVSPQIVTPVYGWEYCAYAPAIRVAMRELNALVIVAAHEVRSRK